jgi:hypothetical protein
VAKLDHWCLLQYYIACLPTHILLAQVKNGVVYEGIFNTMQFEGKDMHVVLKFAKVIRDPNSKLSDLQREAERPIKTLVIYNHDLVQVTATDIKLSPEDLGPALDDDFETDSSISRGRGGCACCCTPCLRPLMLLSHPLPLMLQPSLPCSQSLQCTACQAHTPAAYTLCTPAASAQPASTSTDAPRRSCATRSAIGRELQRWMPDDGMDSSAFLLDGGLEEELGGGSGWNQFEVNKSKFGVTSTFDENIYTTRLDKDSCAISEREAARIAAEIEGHGYSSHGVGYNAHIAEERGFEIDDGQMDEEDKYSSVLGVRSAPAGMPPAAPPKSALPPRQAMQGGGPGSSGSSSGGGASKAPAWSSSGAGVAAVAGAVGVWLLRLRICGG